MVGLDENLRSTTQTTRSYTTMLKWCSLKSNMYFQTEYDSGTLGEIKDIVAAEKQIRELWKHLNDITSRGKWSQALCGAR
ncbi:hypothetical protein GQ600_17615 [Phytophthora cactorum]|nr:hypothetical protein GQ600_17615 [Phytophthora cactorum]